eukprot:358772-Chlamydomonas_euryale.AAC.9
MQASTPSMLRLPPIQGPQPSAACVGLLTHAVQHPLHALATLQDGWLRHRRACTWKAPCCASWTRYSSCKAYLRCKDVPDQVWMQLRGAQWGFFASGPTGGLQAPGHQIDFFDAKILGTENVGVQTPITRLLAYFKSIFDGINKYSPAIVGD